ncbi:MAG: (d)CMP kinase, partial [Alphaproteobacteria bacterium]
ALYRAVGLALLRAGRDPHDAAAAEAAAATLDLALLDDPELRSEVVGEAASIVAAEPRVRERLLAFQRDFAAHPPGGKRGAVLDGRDIGTVICPDADLKLFITASDDVRARRRHEELRQKGIETDFDSVLSDLRVRDARDSGRDAAPLVPADDAVLLDTSELSIDAVFARAAALVEERLAAKR